MCGVPISDRVKAYAQGRERNKSCVLGPATHARGRLGTLIHLSVLFIFYDVDGEGRRTLHKVVHRKCYKTSVSLVQGSATFTITRVI